MHMSSSCAAQAQLSAAGAGRCGSLRTHEGSRRTLFCCGAQAQAQLWWMCTGGPARQQKAPIISTFFSDHRYPYSEYPCRYCIISTLIPKISGGRAQQQGVWHGIRTDHKDKQDFDDEHEIVHARFVSAHAQIR